MTALAALSYSVPTAAVASGLSAQHLRNAINAGDLRARRSSRDKDGNPQGKWVILADDLRAYLDSLPEG